MRQVENDDEPILIMVDEDRKAVLMSEREFNSRQETIIFHRIPPTPTAPIVRLKR